MDCSLPGSSVHRLSQAGILEQVAIPFSRDLPDSGIEPTSPALADSLSHERSPLQRGYIGLYQHQTKALDGLVQLLHLEIQVGKI